MCGNNVEILNFKRGGAQNNHSAENCALLSYYAVSGGNFLPTYRDNLSILSSGVKKHSDTTTAEDGTDRFSRNVSNKLPLLAA
jgi:hypothetical protein